MQRLTPILQQLGIKLQLVEDTSTVHFAERLTKRKNPYQPSAGVYFTLSRDFLRQIGRIGGRVSMSRRSPAQRRSLARAAGRARMAALTPAQRRDLAKRAAAVRWGRQVQGTRRANRRVPNKKRPPPVSRERPFISVIY
jgi:hypothetical protein